MKAFVDGSLLGMCVCCTSVVIIIVYIIINLGTYFLYSFITKLLFKIVLFNWIHSFLLITISHFLFIYLLILYCGSGALISFLILGGWVQFSIIFLNIIRKNFIGHYKKYILFILVVVVFKILLLYWSNGMYKISFISAEV